MHEWGSLQPYRQMSRTWATFSPDQVYRYTLGRRWDAEKPQIAFIMLNPSTATETVSDPTIRRCIGFAKTWGFGALEVGNLFALRSTDPEALYGHSDPIGPENDSAILGIVSRSDKVVVAWGNHGKFKGRDKQVLGLIPHPVALKITASGQPIHPLYVEGSVIPKDYPRLENEVNDAI